MLKDSGSYLDLILPSFPRYQARRRRYATSLQADGCEIPRSPSSSTDSWGIRNDLWHHSWDKNSGSPWGLCFCYPGWWMRVILSLSAHSFHWHKDSRSTALQVVVVKVQDFHLTSCDNTLGKARAASSTLGWVEVQASCRDFTNATEWRWSMTDRQWWKSWIPSRFPLPDTIPMGKVRMGDSLGSPLSLFLPEIGGWDTDFSVIE